MTDFYNLVERLTRTHRVAVHTDNGLVFAMEDGLLQQLRDAVFNSGDSGAVSGNKAKLPMNAPAVDLFTLIDRQVAEVWGKATGKIPGVARTEQMLTEWAAAANPDRFAVVTTPERNNAGMVIHTKAEYLPEALLELWVKQITELFDPPRTAEIFGACVACGESETWRMSDGERVRRTAMVFVRDRITGDSTEARCQACGVSWLPSQFLFLAEAIAANETRHARENEGMTTV